MGQVEACVSLTEELLVGHAVSAKDAYKFYEDASIARGWRVMSKAEGSLVLVKGVAGIEVSDDYYTAAGISNDTIEKARAQFQSLALITVVCPVFGPEACDEAINKLEHR